LEFETEIHNNVFFGYRSKVKDRNNKTEKEKTTESERG